MNQEEQFKKQVIDYVYAGKYARAYGLLHTRIQALLIDDIVKKESSNPSDNSSSKKDCQMVSMPKFVFDMIIEKHPEVKEYYKRGPS